MAVAKAGAKPVSKGGGGIIEEAEKVLSGPLGYDGGSGLLEGGETGSPENKTGKAVEKAASTVVLEAIPKIVLNALLLLAGMALVVYGIMVAVRPPERALSRPGFA
jgi:hypothetical protein